MTNWEEVLRGRGEAPFRKTKEKGANAANWSVTREIIVAGWQAKNLYLVRDGIVELGFASGKTGSFGETSFVDWVLPGDIFGEMEFVLSSGALTTEQPCWQLSAAAVTSCEIVAFSYDRLRGEAALRVLLQQRALERFRSLARRMERIAGQDADAALAATLCELADGLAGHKLGRRTTFWIGYEVPEPVLGRAAGLGRQSASGKIARFARAGLLYKNGDQRLCLLALDRLREIAEPPDKADAASEDAAVDRVAGLIGAGQNFRARNVALELLPRFPNSMALRYRAALACARAGALEEALSLVRSFGFDASIEAIEKAFEKEQEERRRREIEAGEDEDDAVMAPGAARRGGRHRRDRQLLIDIAAISGRLQKDLAFATEDPALRRERLAAAHTRYSAVAERFGDQFALTNAEAMAVLLGRAERHGSQSILREGPGPNPGYFALITQAEASLMLGDRAGAAGWAKAAGAAPDAATGARASTRLQMKRLGSVLPADDIAALLTEIPVPVSTVYSGHMMRADALQPAAQQAAEAELAAPLGACLGDAPRHAFGALASGADILFAEHVLETGGALHVVLPSRVDQFLEWSVKPGDRVRKSGSWARRFDACLGEAASITFVQSGEIAPWEQDACFEAAFRVAAGLSLLSADMLCGTAEMMAVYDGGPVTNIAGTARAVATARAAGLPVSVIPCPWRKPATGGATLASAETPFRPVLFIWRENASGTGTGRPSRRGAKAPIEIDLPSTEGATLVPIERADTSFSGAAVVCRDARSALGIAAACGSRAAEIIVLDHGIVLGRDGAINPTRLATLRGGAGPLKVPAGMIVATETFAAEARLQAPDIACFEAAGVCEPKGREHAGKHPSPSIPLYRLITSGRGTP